jgi:hypothetical protein
MRRPVMTFKFEDLHTRRGAWDSLSHDAREML